MVFWVTAAGTITKRFLSAEAQQAVVEHRDEFGQIGWFALSILVLTGIFMLYHHGVTFEHMTSSPFGRLLSMKLCLVALMIGLQHYVGPKRPILGWVNLFVALGVIGLSTSLVR
jgi:putative copper export protein